jgi:hypothetical protein
MIINLGPVIDVHSEQSHNYERSGARWEGHIMAHMLPFLLPIPAHMGDLEPSIFVVPVPFVIELTLDFESLSIEVEYFQEDFDGESGNRHVTSRRQIMITGTVMSFGGKFRDKHMLNIPLRKK